MAQRQKKNHSSLSSPIALVTGGARRLGRHIALRLAREGYDVAILRHATPATKVVREIRAMGRRCIAVRANMRSVKEIRRAVKSVMAEFGSIDLLVNNAGIFIDVDWSEIDERGWDAVISTNLKGPTFLMQEVARSMKSNGGGAIVNIASLGGLQPWKRHIPYNVSKAGLIMSTRCFARVLAPSIRVNAIAPGTIIIPGEEDPDVRHVARRTIPLQRYGAVEDITELVVFLATRAPYITGQVIAVDGGRSTVQIGE